MENYSETNIKAWFSNLSRNKSDLRKALREIDLAAAIAIASDANQRVRDKYGNVTSEIWNLRFNDPNGVSGKLMTDKDIKVYLDGMIADHIAQNKSILMECDSNDTFITWMLEFIREWENKCRQLETRSFDISEGIISVMKESLEFTHQYMMDTAYDQQKIEDKYKAILYNLDPAETTHLKFFTVNEAVVRFFFRNEVTSKYMTFIAGKLLQKREVINRAGSLASKVQNNAIVAEYDRAIRNAIVKFQSLSWDPKFEDQQVLKYYAVDHTFHK